MAKYSRKEKWKELRETLQNDSEAEIRTQDLNSYQKRLSDAAPEHFDAPEAQTPSRLNSVRSHERRTYPTEEAPVQMPARETASANNGFSKDYFRNSANYTTAFNNEYLDDYIREVKEYNIDQGVSRSENTDLDILRSLRNDPTPAPRKPYPDEAIEVSPSEITRPAAQPRREAPAVKEADTADISFGNEKRRAPAAVAEKRPVTVPIKENPLPFIDD